MGVGSKRMTAGDIRDRRLKAFRGLLRSVPDAAMGNFIVDQAPVLPSNVPGRVLLDQLVSRQAALVAYLGDFYLMFIVALLALPLVLLMHRPGRRVQDEELTAAVE
jgi:hypothetical protein